jgi:hypothetical protein
LGNGHGGESRREGNREKTTDEGHG